MSAPRRRGVTPANDNGKEPLHAVLDMPDTMPVQPVEVEVFAELLDSFANDNEALP